MYVGDNNMVHFVDEVRYWFIIWSMITLTLWYNVSLQCSYCDCQDLASKCKHLLEFRHDHYEEYGIPMWVVIIYRPCGPNANG